MNELPTPFWKRFLLISVPSLICIAYLCSTVLSFAPKKAKALVRINNSTRSFEVLSAEKQDDQIKITFRNNNDKAITAVVLTSTIDAQTVFTYTEEYAFSEGDHV